MGRNSQQKWRAGWLVFLPIGYNILFHWGVYLEQKFDSEETKKDKLGVEQEALPVLGLVVMHRTHKYSIEEDEEQDRPVKVARLYQMADFNAKATFFPVKPRRRGIRTLFSTLNMTFRIGTIIVQIVQTIHIL